MGIFYWVRTFVMVLAFAGTVFVIREMNQPVSESRLRLFSFLGSPPDPSLVVVNLCPTRISKLTLADGTVILQRGLDWTRVTGAGEVKLDQVAVEKWFSAYCLFEAKKTSASADVSTVLTLEYVTGPAQTLIKSAGGDFEWAGRPFRSDKMAQALAGVNTFPAALSK
jgi:hypothetical protein